MRFRFLNTVFPNMGCSGPKERAILLLWLRGERAVHLQRPGQAAEISERTYGAQDGWCPARTYEGCLPCVAGRDGE